MEQCIMRPIGIIRTPYKEPKDIPIQGIFKQEVQGYLELKQQYREGLQDLEKFSHAILLYFFHRSQQEDVVSQPFLEKKAHGIFSIRSPHRPNHIGLSIVKIDRIEGNKLYFNEVDMLDETPLLDIKPFVKFFDNRDNSKGGWIEKHFLKGNVPDQTILR